VNNGERRIRFVGADPPRISDNGLAPVQARLRLGVCKQNARNVRTSEQSFTAANQKL